MTERRFWAYVRPYRSRLAQACLAMVGVAALNGASVYLLKPIVDHVFVSKDFDMLWLAIVGAPLLVAAKTAASYVQNYLMSWIGQRVTQELREDLFRRLHELPLDYYAEHRSGEILSRATNDLNTVQTALTTVPLYLIRDTLTMLVLLGVLFHLDWRFALISLLVLPAASATMVVLGRKMRASSLSSQMIMGHIYDRFQDSLHGMTLIKAHNYEEGAIERFREENLSFFNATMRYLRASALAGPLMEFAGSMVVAVLIYYGGKEIISGHMTPGAFFAFMGSFLAAIAPAKNLARLNSELQRGLASGERIFQLLDERPPAARGGVARFEGLRDSLRLEGVSFLYPRRERPALDGASFAVAAGGRLTVVGPSGSGKTTLAQILVGLREPASGRMTADGRDCNEFDPRSWRERTALIEADAKLLNDTLLQNVALGRRIVTLSEVEAACKAVGADEFIASLPQGYLTPLGERGARLTLEQRQRLAIARALLKDPTLVVLDDFAAFLDPDAESGLLNALEPLAAGRTLIYLAPRPPLRPLGPVVHLHRGRLVHDAAARTACS